MFLILAAQSCDNFGKNDFDAEEQSFEELSHEMIVLGDQLEDPYSVPRLWRRYIRQRRIVSTCSRLILISAFCLRPKRSTTVS